MSYVLEYSADTGASVPGMVALRRAASRQPTFVFFPHAGGSPLSVGPVAAALPPAVGIMAVNLVGDYATPLQRPRRVDAAVGLVLQGLLSLTAHEDCNSMRLVLVGNSYGALLAYETACALMLAGISIERLVVSGFRSPALASTDAPLHRLAPRQLRAELAARFAGAALPVGQDEGEPEAEQALRADLEACDTYCHKRRESLAVPIDVMHLTDDLSVSVRELSVWSALTSAPTTARPLAAGHFPWATHPDAVARILLASTVGHLGSPHGPARSKTMITQQ